MPGNQWPAREMTFKFSHPAMQNRPFRPLVFNAMREFEAHGLIVVPLIIDEHGNHITHFTSSEGVEMVVTCPPAVPA